MVLQEGLANAGVAQQEGAELFRKHVIGSHRIPRLGRHLVLGRARLGHLAEVAVGEVLHFVVVVEDHPVLAGDAKVLVEHVAREDVGRHHVADGHAVLIDGIFARGLVGLLFQVKVQRGHPPFDVQVADDDAVALLDHQRGGGGSQFGQQLGGQPFLGEGHVRVFPRVGHPAGAVVVLHQVVAVLDVLAADVLAAHVLDVLEDIRERGQREHAHHQTLDAGRDDEMIGGFVQMLQQVAVEECLALLVQAQHGVELGLRLGGHQRPQEAHVGGRHRHVHHEVGPRKVEEPLDVLGCEQHRVDEHAALAVAQQGQREGLHLAVIDDAADEVGALVAVEERAQHVHLAIHGPRCLLAEQGGGSVDHLLQVILDVPVAAGQPHVDEDLAQDLLPGTVLRVIDPE